MSSSSRLLLRKARKEDSRDLWQWRNDKQSRRNSLNTKKISWGEHCQWFGRCLKGSKHSVLIATAGEHKVGMIRFDFGQDGTANVNLNINPQFRGQRFGVRILKMASRLMGRRYPRRIQTAVIKKMNGASEKVFSRAGFKKIHSADKGGYSIWIRP